MRNKREKDEIIKMRKIIITVMIITLSGILINSYINYRKESEKIEIKKSVREYLLAVAAARSSDNIEFDETETIIDIKLNGGQKLDTIEKYINIDKLNNIESLTIEDANKIVNNEEEFEVNNKGQFIKIK